MLKMWMLSLGSNNEGQDILQKISDRHCKICNIRTKTRESRSELEAGRKSHVIDSREVVGLEPALKPRSRQRLLGGKLQTG